MEKGILASATEAVLRTAYKCFNLYLGTQIYFSVNRGNITQPHAWVAYFNIEGAARDNKDTAGNIGSFVPGAAVSFGLKELWTWRISSFGVMFMTWFMKLEQFFINPLMGAVISPLNRLEQIIFKDGLKNLAARMRKSFPGKLFAKLSDLILKASPAVINDKVTGKAVYRFTSAIFGSLFWLADLMWQHSPDVYYPLEAPITNWYMYVAPIISLYAGLVSKNFLLAVIGSAFLFVTCVMDVQSAGIFYILGGLTKSLAAFTAMVFIGKFHEKMHPVYSFITKRFSRN
ncbi:MAG: hypothetical protein U9O97_07340 [Elusimicrobiota bacterium]|nr:hypothetical protein [Elusimicrobiota bacterium]